MSTIEEIVEAVKQLSPEKRDEVRRQLVLLWPQNSRAAAGDVESPGLVTKRARPRRPPIHIKGKPISETIIEDRR